MRLAVVFLLFCSAKQGFSDEETHRMSKGLHANAKMLPNQNVFNPRMEYDEWTPLGRGDPLKNDPTYDYVPPVLERVHYWMDPSKRTPDPPALNSGVLVLGSLRTEPSFTMRLTTPKYPAKEPQADSRLDTMSLLDPILKLMDASKFGINLNPSANQNYYKPNANRVHQMSYQRPVHHQYTSQRYQQPQALQRPPYTMLMPPPPPPPPSTTTPTPTTTTTEAVKTQPTTQVIMQTTTAAATTTTTTAKTSTNLTTIFPTTVFANTENVYKPVAIAMPEENEAIRNDQELKKKEEIVLAISKNGASEDVKSKGQLLRHQKRPSQEHTPKPKEPYKYRPLHEPTQDNRLQTTNVMTSQLKGTKREEKPQTKWGVDHRATTARSMTTTASRNTLTTDPMFKHYKQPSEPIKGPFYLIIQGHSKVKTYGASKNPVNGMLTSNEIRKDADGGKEHYGQLYKLEELKRRKGKTLMAKSKKTFGSGDGKTPAISGLVDADVGFDEGDGEGSKKRFLGDGTTAAAPTMITLMGSTTPETTDNLDVESLIALNDDYDPEDIISLVLKDEGQGSGLGDLVVSVISDDDHQTS